MNALANRFEGRLERLRDFRSPEPTLDVSVEQLNAMLGAEPLVVAAEPKKPYSKAHIVIEQLRGLHYERQLAMTGLFIQYTGLILEGVGPDKPIKKTSTFHSMQKRIGDVTLSVMHNRESRLAPWKPYALSYDSGLMRDMPHETDALRFGAFNVNEDAYISKPLPLSTFMGSEKDGNAMIFDNTPEGQVAALEATERAMELSNCTANLVMLRDPAVEQKHFYDMRARFALHASRAIANLNFF